MTGFMDGILVGGACGR